MITLKPSEEVQLAALSVAAVLTVFALDAPSLADVRVSQPNTPQAQHVHGSVKTAAYTAAAVVVALALLGKSPTVYVVGGMTIAAETWKFYHANAIDPATGKVPAGTGQQGS